jgi:hypothetical protein
MQKRHSNKHCRVLAMQTRTRRNLLLPVLVASLVLAWLSTPGSVGTVCRLSKSLADMVPKEVLSGLVPKNVGYSG